MSPAESDSEQTTAVQSRVCQHVAREIARLYVGDRWACKRCGVLLDGDAPQNPAELTALPKVG